MFKYYILYILIVGLSITSCKNKNKKNDSKAAVSDTTNGFPAIDLLREDVDDVTKTPYYLYKKTTNVKTNKLIDSAALTRDEFKKIIEPITTIDVTSKAAKENFKEISFHDLSTKSYSIITTPLNENTEVKSITTLLNDETNKLKNIFIVIEKRDKDSTIRSQYFWKANKSLQITVATEYKRQTVKEIKYLISWNDIVE